MTPAEGTAWLRREAEEQMTYTFSAMDQEEAESLENAKRYTTAADLIESLTAERDALAGMLLEKDEALKAMPHSSLACMEAGCFRNAAGGADLKAGHTPQCHWHKRTEALALKLPAAAAQVAEWREKAGLLEWYDQNPSVVRKQFGHWWAFNVKGETIGIPFDTPLPALRAAKEADNA